ncbi:MAG: serine/threonine-protein kinase [Planctomycetota bacterium]|nr:serine/threonine-protein kinase [Planctomycetota bacterium]
MQSENADSLIGKEIEARYRIDAELGAGGMGVVYKARHLLLGTDVALKVIHPALASTPEARERFLREARAAMALSHSNIVAVREVSESAGRLFLTMDLVKGATLAAVAAQQRPMPVARAVGIISQVLAALAEAHRCGIVHRDLKPGNIMIEEGDKAKVLDFGLAKSVTGGAGPSQDSLTATGMVMGTLRYMAPEQMAGDPVDARTDLYAVSAMFYELLSGKPPHEADSNQQLMRKILLDEPPPLEGPLGALVMQGLKKEKEKRPGSAEEYLRLLNDVFSPRTAMTAMTPQVRREVVLDQAHPAQSRAGLIVALVGVVLVLIIVFVAYRMVRSGQYRTAIDEANTAMARGDHEAAAKAFDMAAEIDQTAEAILGARKAKLEWKRTEAKKAESERRWSDAIRLWKEAAGFAETPDLVKDDIARAEEALRTRPGTLVVKTNPTGLMVRVADFTAKAAPVRFEGIPAGQVQVEVTRPDSYPRLAVAEVRGDSETVVEVDLPALEAEEGQRYDLLTAIVRSGNIESAIAECTDYLRKLPGGYATAEVLLVRRILECLAGKVAPAPHFEAKLPEALRSAAGYALSPSAKILCGLDYDQNLFYTWNLATGKVRGPVSANSPDALQHLGGWAANERFLWSSQVVQLDETQREKYFEWWDIEVGSDGKCERTDKDGSYCWAQEGRLILHSEFFERVVRGIATDSGTVLWTINNNALLADYDEGEELPRYVVLNHSGDRILDTQTNQVFIPSFGADSDWVKMDYDPDLQRVVLAGTRSDRPYVGVYDLQAGKVLSSFGLSRSLGHEILFDARLSPDGNTFLCTYQDGGWARTPLDNPAGRVEMPFDAKTQYGFYGLYKESRGYASIATRQSEVESDPFYKVEVYDINTGERIFVHDDVWLYVTIGELTDSEVLVLEGLDANRSHRTVIVDRKTNAIVCDQGFGDNMYVTYLPGLNLIYARRMSAVDSWQGDSLYVPGAEEPFWSGPPLIGLDRKRGIALGGGSDRFYTDPWKRVELEHFSLDGSDDPPRWFDLGTMHPLVVDRAFLARRGKTPPVRVGGWWVHRSDDGRLSLWREQDLVDALVPWTSAVPLRPGELLRTAEALVEEYEGK